MPVGPRHEVHLHTTPASASSSSSPSPTLTRPATRRHPIQLPPAHANSPALARSGRAMGCGFSSNSGGLRPFEGVRVIHTNGYVQDFDADAPVTVARATASCSSSSSTQYVLCSSAHLLHPGRALYRPDDALEPGTVYFLLPHSVFQAESSAVDLACLMNRLTALARKGGGHAPCPVDALFAGNGRTEDQATTKSAAPPRPAGKWGCAAAAPWRPQLDRIDESIGRSSMRSTVSSCSVLSQD